jgi:type I restriction enzyme M protein
MLRRRQLGQYFTPPEVVDLALAVVGWLQPGLARGTLLDPSCGEGAFLQGALRAGFAPDRLYGLDSDPAMVPVWRAAGLLGRAPAPCLAIADGLGGGGRAQFDVVAGNPPFAGTMSLSSQLTIAGLDQGTFPDSPRGAGGSLPRELWFLQRSLGLLRPGGLLALVLPEGVLANRRWRDLRSGVLAANQVEAIIGLPRRTFRASRTTVKTCLVIARRQPPAPGHRVRLAELEADELADGAEEVLAAWGGAEVRAEGCPWERGPA